MPIKKRRKQKLSVEDINRLMLRIEELSQDELLSQELDVLFVKDIAKHLNLSVQTVKKRIKQGDIPAHTAANGKIFFLRSDFSKNLLTEDGMLTCDEVAKKIRVTTRTIRNWIKNGTLAAKKCGHKWLIDHDDFIDFLESGLYQ